MEKQELKAAIKGLENANLIIGSLYKELINKLIDIFLLDEDRNAAEFWKSKI